MNRFGRDLAHYFGLGGPDRDRPSTDADETWVTTAVRVLPAVTVAFVLREALDLDGFDGLLAFLGLAMVLAGVWAVVLSVALRRRGFQARRPDGKPPCPGERSSGHR